MDFHLKQAGEKMDKRAEQARKKHAREKKAKARTAAAVAARENEARQRVEAARAVERRREAEEMERQAEELRRTGGVAYCRVLRAAAAPLALGDRVALPASSLEELIAAGVFDQDGPMLFEIKSASGASSHGGVLEFTAEDGAVALPHKVAASLGLLAGAAEGEALTVTYVRLPKGASVRLQPVKAGLMAQSEEVTSAANSAVVEQLLAMGFPAGGTERAALATNGTTRDELQLQQCIQWLTAPARTASELEDEVPSGLHAVLLDELKNHATLSVGDVICVSTGQQAFDVQVVELEPARAVSLVDTELAVELLPSIEHEEAVAAKAAAEREAAERDAARRHAAQAEQAEQAEQAALLAAQDAQAMAAEGAARALAARAAAAAEHLPVEPEAGPDSVCTCMVRLPDGARLTRRLRAGETLTILFCAIDAAGHTLPEDYALASSYPRRTVARAEAASLAPWDAQLSLFVA